VLQLFATIKGVQKQAIAGISVCCSVLQRVAALRRHQGRAKTGHFWYTCVLQCVAVRCSVLQCIAVLRLPHRQAKPDLGWYCIPVTTHVCF